MQFKRQNVSLVYCARFEHEPRWTIRVFKDVTRTEYDNGYVTYQVVRPQKILGLINEECFLTEDEARSHLKSAAERMRADLLKKLSKIPEPSQLSAIEPSFDEY